MLLLKVLLVSMLSILMREQLVSLHNIDKNTFTWRRLRMALSYIKLEGTDIVVKIGWLEKIFLLF